MRLPFFSDFKKTLTKEIRTFIDTVKNKKERWISALYLVFILPLMYLSGRALYNAAYPKSTTTRNLTVINGNLIENSTIQNSNISQISQIQTSTKPTQESLLNGPLVLVGLNVVDGPVLPEAFGLLPDPSIQGSDGLYRTPIKGVIAVLPGARTPSIDAITTPLNIKCALPSFVPPPVVIVSGKFVGRIGYIYKSECTSRKEITREDMASFQVHFNY